ncbi:hypothetical protein BCR43DRAFT_564277 [Syncephalastrum racemosum]|uniref:STB6-like N-terminal domain-containing protein n=1 Tax=Syncephalastrum racemosum TaxID=13706 RepID=A0A1X2H9P3_SYNRA|nr:hypothetical protein BCR43DRAFT_564277 [Syncephalastrum racemosum]
MADVKQFVIVERKKALQLAACGLGIVQEEAYLAGYQIYIIEQWVCDRSITSNTVKVFTGDQNHVIKVCVISISTAELQHPRPEIQSFFNTGTPLKFKSTPLGEIMLTDPSELPYDMDMVLVPDGDYDKWINQAYVNINLRRTNCTGRSALNLRKPNPASEEKFRSLYKIADAVEFESAVINLVTVAQVALYLFNLLKKDYIDGLICNETTSAFWEFYTKYHPHKSPEYTIKEPWMEPHLLTALISKLVVCRNKLHAYNFTTIKDPFAEYEHFRFDIEEYQRVKNLKRTKMIDLETLEKLNEYSVSQLKVRKVIKTKLDDISGIGNSPLFIEISDPEQFRSHATIESLRAIWRPRLKSIGGDSDKAPHELLHMIKGVSARTTRTSGAAAEILSKFAGSFPWVESRQSHSGGRKSGGNSSRVSPDTPSRPYPPRVATQVTNIEVTTPSGVSNVEDVLYSPVQERPMEPMTTMSSDEEMYSDSYRSEFDLPSSSWRMSPDDNLSSRITTDSRSRRHVVVASPTTLQSSIASDTDESQDHGDFVPSHRPHRIPRRARSVSDSVLPISIYNPRTGFPQADESKSKSSGGSSSVFRGKHAQQPGRKRSKSDRFASPKRVTSLTMIPVLNETDSDDSEAERPSVTMDIRTYLIYEKMQRQHTALRAAYKDLRKTAHMYEERAERLRTTYLRRSAEFAQIERAAYHAMDEQAETERRLKEAEDGSAKLHYELNVLNENLKDVEDNVAAFYGKVGMLERRMNDSQQSITTILIIGNYFYYYWRKIKGWIGWHDHDPQPHQKTT